MWFLTCWNVSRSLRELTMICCGTNSPLLPFNDKMTSTAILELSLEQADLVYYSGDRIRGALIVHVAAPVTIAGELLFINKCNGKNKCLFFFKTIWKGKIKCEKLALPLPLVCTLNNMLYICMSISRFTLHNTF